MEITYDKEADALYIEFRKGEFSKNKKIDDFTIIDLDKDENILGIEILEASKKIPIESLSKIYLKNLPPLKQITQKLFLPIADPSTSYPSDFSRHVYTRP